MWKRRLGKARKALEEERFEEAISILEELMKTDDGDPDVMVYLGIAYIQVERPEDAVEVLSKVDDMVEEHCVVSLFLGRALKSLGRHEEAEYKLRDAVRLEPAQQDNWEDLAEVLFLQRKYRESLEVIEEGLLHFPRSVQLRSLYAICLHRLGDYTASADEWAVVHTLRPDSLTAVANCAYLLLLLEQPDDAHPYIKYSRELDPNDYRSLILIGEYSFQKGDREAAREWFLRVLEVAPDNIQALGRLAVIESLDGNDSLSRKYITIAEEEMSNEPQSWRGLCYVYSKLNMEEREIDCLLRGTELDTGSAAPWVRLAHEYTKRGLASDAEHAWRMSFKLRGYVKVTCPECAKNMRLTCEKFDNFDMLEPVECIGCGDTFPIPENLAVL